ncbi:tissue-resident T-cell transcription regulator protein ZNF683 [Suncus etruscus]|uniref:tissue-resident T-cell transcription regulator protein ZNF683 n=1 Tax=Suncus etruscus TaxID=109475 RepID=UPI0021109611|nr:tissue-resident T-cell transcription regulator protein ZNF683 [Suncus etruscus]
MSSQLERDTCSSSSTSSSSPDAWLSPKSPNPLAFCSCPSPAPNSKGLPLCLYPFYPSYPLLPSPCLLSCGALPSVQCSPVFILPQDISHATILVPNVLRSVSDLRDCSASGDTLFPHLRATQTSHPAQSSQAQHAGPGMAKTCSSWPECDGKRSPAKQNSPGSQVAASVLPYPLKKENGRIRYECNECGKSFGQLSNLKVHWRVHSGERPFQCTLCQKRFTQFAHLQKHHLVHTGERPHKCPMCFKHFSCSSNLKTHMRLHSRTRPFQCSVCPSSFSQHVHLMFHQRQHAPQTCHLALTYMPLAPLTCLAQWHQGAPDLVVAPAEMGRGTDKVRRRGSLGDRVLRRLARLGDWRERRGKRTPKETRGRVRPWGGQSCPDLAGQGSSSSVSLKAQLQSCSEWDLLAGSGGSWPWKQRHNSRGLASPLGRLRRPAVGSASDLASYASLRLESPAVASAELTCAQNPTELVTTPEHSEQRFPGCTCPQHPQSTASKGPLGPPSNRGGMLPRPAGFPMTEGAKGDSAIPWSALPAAAQPLHRRPSVRRTRYYITVTLQGRGEEPQAQTTSFPSPGFYLDPKQLRVGSNALTGDSSLPKPL